MNPPDDNTILFFSFPTGDSNSSSEDTVKHFQKLYESSPISQEPGNERFFQELASLNSAASSTDTIVTGSFGEFVKQEKHTFLEQIDNVVATIQLGITASASKSDEQQNRS